MNRVVKWAFGAGLAGMIATGAGAQLLGSDSEAFLTAIREQDGAKVQSLASSSGTDLVNYRGFGGDTPLTVAMTNRSGSFVGFLLGRGANPDLADKQGDTPLIIAARSGYVEGIDRMLSARADVNAANRQGETALIVAVLRRHPQAVRRLLEAGADADKADFAAGYSARDYARRDTRNRELLRLIETIKPARRSVAGPVRD